MSVLVQKELLEAVSSVTSPEDAIVSAFSRIFSTVAIDGKVSMPSGPMNEGDGLTYCLIGVLVELLTNMSFFLQGKGLDVNQRGVLDAAARAVLAQMVSGAVAAAEPVMTWRQQPQAPPVVPQLLDMFLLTSEQKFMDPGRHSSCRCLTCNQPPA